MKITKQHVVGILGTIAFFLCALGLIAAGLWVVTPWSFFKVFLVVFGLVLMAYLVWCVATVLKEKRLKKGGNQKKGVR